MALNPKKANRNMRFEFTVNGRKCLKKLEKKLAERILKKIFFWEKAGQPLKYADKMEGNSNFFRYRIGDYRIIVLPNLKKGTIDILRIDHRKNVYESLNRL
jgi:mRNA-degrading endonuclease RelE of RelBE toxin-antitoxin system